MFSSVDAYEGKEINDMVADHHPSIDSYGKNGFTICRKLGME